MSQENITIVEVIDKAIKATLSELVALVPKIMLTVFLVATFAIITYLVVRLINRILKFVRIDDLIKPLIERYQIPISISTLITLMTILGMSMLTVYAIASIVFPEYLEGVVYAMSIISRIASVVFMIFFVFVSITATMERIRMERGMRGFMILLSLLISLVLVIDVTNLSPELKSAIAWGLSLGIGLSIGVFTAWYFFGSEISKRRENTSKR